LPRWFQVERKNSVIRNGTNALDPDNYRANVRMGKWTEDGDIKLKDAVQELTVARIGMQLPLWIRVERKNSVVENGIKAWMQASIERMDVWVSWQQKTKTVS
jgi:hypothetical protein